MFLYEIQWVSVAWQQCPWYDAILLLLSSNGSTMLTFISDFVSDGVTKNDMSGIDSAVLSHSHQQGHF